VLNFLNTYWEKIISGHAVMATAIVIGLLVIMRFMVLRIGSRNIDDKFVRLRYKRGVSYAFFFIAVILLLPIWLPSIRNIATFLGIFGAGFLIVTREIWVSMGGWLYIMVRRPYVIGDRVQIGAISGDVIDIRLMETSIMEILGNEGSLATGRIVFFPNAKIFTEVVATQNQKISHISQELQFRLAPSSNWEKAVEILESLAKDHHKIAIEAKQQLAADDHETDFLAGYRDPRVLVEISGNEILLKLQFMAPTGQVVHMTDRIWRGFLAALKTNPEIRLPE